MKTIKLDNEGLKGYVGSETQRFIELQFKDETVLLWFNEATGELLQVKSRSKNHTYYFTKVTERLINDIQRNADQLKQILKGITQ